MDIPTDLEKIQKELKTLKEKNKKDKVARSIRTKRYRNTLKGKQAIRRANKKYYKPTGNKVGPQMIVPS